MKVIRLVFMVAIAMALYVALITPPKATQTSQNESLLEKATPESEEEAETVLNNFPTQRISRFLAAHTDKDASNDQKSSVHDKKHPKDHSGHQKKLPKDHNSGHQKKPPKDHKESSHHKKPPKDHRRSDHCKKDHDICGLAMPDVANATCCNNKCVDLHYTSNHCGACKNKCLPFQDCCRGQCVNLSFDKRHCGACNRRCMPGGFCIYGECDYA